MASTMSFPSTNYPFLFPPSNDIDAQTSPFFSFPSPPSSDPGLEFDLESFTHTSPDNSFMLDDTFSWDFTTALNANPAPQQTKLPAPADVSPLFSASTPASTNLISPKTSISSFNDVVGPLASVPVAQQSDADTAEALSTHHLQRYLHYKALAAQVEADARATAVLQSQQDFDAFLASCSAPQMQTAFDSGINGKVDAVPTIGIQSLQPAMYTSDAPQYFAYDPQQQASMAHAQAEAHRQAHDIAAARAQQQRVQTGYWVANTQNAFGPTQPQHEWSRTSISSLPDLTASFQTSPDYSSIAPNMVKSTSLPSIAPIAVESVPIIAPVPVHSAPPSIIQSIESEEEKENAEPILSFPSDLPIPNLHGGGRGYIPGQTPDDPKKRHKCGICGRGFARAFNLKSHIQTHNPVRTKPHQCPHATCKRGFSRLHDLERHRQGIHNDGPLVDNTKVKSVSPSTVRAQSRMIAKVEDQTSDLTATFVAPQ